MQGLSVGTATSAQHRGEQEPSDVAFSPGQSAGASSPEAAQEPSHAGPTCDGAETARTARNGPAGQRASDAGGNEQASVESASTSSHAVAGRQVEQPCATLQPSQRSVLVKSVAEKIQRHMARFGLLVCFFELHRPGSTPGLVNSRGGGHQTIDVPSSSQQASSNHQRAALTVRRLAARCWGTAAVRQAHWLAEWLA